MNARGQMGKIHFLVCTENVEIGFRFFHSAAGWRGKNELLCIKVLPPRAGAAFVQLRLIVWERHGGRFLCPGVAEMK
jgi:hypothetical protein